MSLSKQLHFSGLPWALLPDFKSWLDLDDIRTQASTKYLPPVFQHFISAHHLGLMNINQIFYFLLALSHQCASSLMKSETPFGSECWRLPCESSIMRKMFIHKNLESTQNWQHQPHLQDSVVGIEDFQGCLLRLVPCSELRDWVFLISMDIRSSVLNAFSNRLSEDPSLGLYLHSPFVDIPAETPGARSSPSNYLLCSWSCSTERSLEFAIVDLWSSVCTGLSWTWMECIPGFGENNWSSLIDNRDLKVLHPARPQSSSLFYHFTQFVHWTVALSRNLTATQLKSLPDSRVSTSL